MIQVRTHTGQTLEFPEGTQPAAIQQVLDRDFPVRAASKPEPAPAPVAPSPAAAPLSVVEMMQQFSEGQKIPQDPDIGRSSPLPPSQMPTHDSFGLPVGRKALPQSPAMETYNPARHGPMPGVGDVVRNMDDRIFAGVAKGVPNILLGFPLEALGAISNMVDDPKGSDPTQMGVGDLARYTLKDIVTSGRAALESYDKGVDKFAPRIPYADNLSLPDPDGTMPVGRRLLGGLSSGSESLGHMGGAFVNGKKNVIQNFMKDVTAMESREYRKEGFNDGFSFLMGGTHGVMEGFFESRPIGMLFDGLGGKNWKRKVAEFVLREVGQESFTEIGQAGIDKLTRNPDMTLSEFRERYLNMLASLPVAVGGMAGTSVAVSRLNAAKEKRDFEAWKNQATAAEIMDYLAQGGDAANLQPATPHKKPFNNRGDRQPIDLSTPVDSPPAPEQDSVELKEYLDEHGSQIVVSQTVYSGKDDDGADAYVLVTETRDGKLRAQPADSNGKATGEGFSGNVGADPLAMVSAWLFEYQGEISAKEKEFSGGAERKYRARFAEKQAANREGQTGFSEVHVPPQGETTRQMLQEALNQVGFNSLEDVPNDLREQVVESAKLALQRRVVEATDDTQREEFLVAATELENLTLESGRVAGDIADNAAQHSRRGSQKFEIGDNIILDLQGAESANLGESDTRAGTSGRVISVREDAALVELAKDVPEFGAKAGDRVKINVNTGELLSGFGTGAASAARRGSVRRSRVASDDIQFSRKGKKGKNKDIDAAQAEQDEWWAAYDDDNFSEESYSQSKTIDDLFTQAYDDIDDGNLSVSEAAQKVADNSNYTYDDVLVELAGEYGNQDIDSRKKAPYDYNKGKSDETVVYDDYYNDVGNYYASAYGTDKSTFYFSKKTPSWSLDAEMAKSAEGEITEGGAARLTPDILSSLRNPPPSRADATHMIPFNTSEADVIARVLRRMIEAGFPRQVIRSINGFGIQNQEGYRGVSGAYDGLSHEVRFARYVMDDMREFREKQGFQKALRFLLTHEMTHAIEADRNENTLSMQSPLFRMPVEAFGTTEHTNSYETKDFKTGKMRTVTYTNKVANMNLKMLGPVVAEMVSVYSGDTQLARVLSYPYASLTSAANLKGDAQLAEIKRIQAESFAQLGALYFTYPELVKEHMPRGYALFEEIKHAGNYEDRPTRRRKLRGPLQIKSTRRSDEDVREVSTEDAERGSEGEQGTDSDIQFARDGRDVKPSKFIWVDSQISDAFGDTWNRESKRRVNGAGNLPNSLLIKPGFTDDNGVVLEMANDDFFPGGAVFMEVGKLNETYAQKGGPGTGFGYMHLAFDIHYNGKAKRDEAFRSAKDADDFVKDILNNYTSIHRGQDGKNGERRTLVVKKGIGNSPDGVIVLQDSRRKNRDGQMIVGFSVTTAYEGDLTYLIETSPKISGQKVYENKYPDLGINEAKRQRKRDKAEAERRAKVESDARVKMTAEERAEEDALSQEDRDFYIAMRLEEHDEALAAEETDTQNSRTGEALAQGMRFSKAKLRELQAVGNKVAEASNNPKAKGSISVHLTNRSTSIPRDLRGRIPSDVRGLHWVNPETGKPEVHIFLNKMQSETDFYVVLMHEFQRGHFPMHQFFGTGSTDFNRFRREIWDAFRDEKKMRVIIKKTDYNPNNAEDQLKLAEEFASESVQGYVKSDIDGNPDFDNVNEEIVSMWDKVVSAVRKMLRHFIKFINRNTGSKFKPVQINEKDLLVAMSAIQMKVHKGGKSAEGESDGDLIMFSRRGIQTADGTSVEVDDEHQFVPEELQNAPFFSQLHARAAADSPASGNPAKFLKWLKTAQTSGETIAVDITEEIAGIDALEGELLDKFLSKGPTTPIDVYKKGAFQITKKQLGKLIKHQKFRGYFQQLAPAIMSPREARATLHNAQRAFRGGRVKANEVEEMGLVEFLESLPPNETLTRAEFSSWINAHKLIIEDMYADVDKFQTVYTPAGALVDWPATANIQDLSFTNVGHAPITQELYDEAVAMYAEESGLYPDEIMAFPLKHLQQERVNQLAEANRRFIYKEDITGFVLVGRNNREDDWEIWTPEGTLFRSNIVSGNVSVGIAEEEIKRRREAGEIPPGRNGFSTSQRPRSSLATRPGNWAEYTMNGGDGRNNYRTLLLRIPLDMTEDSYDGTPSFVYSGHWGSTAGVAVYIRLSDYPMNGKIYLLIEELQSDWVQVGGLTGYSKEASEGKVEALQVEIDALMVQPERESASEEEAEKEREKRRVTEDGRTISEWVADMSHPDSDMFEGLDSDHEWRVEGHGYMNPDNMVDYLENPARNNEGWNNGIQQLFDFAREDYGIDPPTYVVEAYERSYKDRPEGWESDGDRGRYAHLDQEGRAKVNLLEQELNAARDYVPDMPFKKVYTAIAMKRLARMVVDDGYAGMIMSPGQVHAKRWDTDMFLWSRKGEYNEEDQQRIRRLKSAAESLHIAHNSAMRNYDGTLLSIERTQYDFEEAVGRQAELANGEQSATSEARYVRIMAANSLTATRNRLEEARQEQVLNRLNIDYATEEPLRVFLAEKEESKKIGEPTMPPDGVYDFYADLRMRNVVGVDRMEDIEKAGYKVTESQHEDIATQRRELGQLVSVDLNTDRGRLALYNMLVKSFGYAAGYGNLSSLSTHTALAFLPKIMKMMAENPNGATISRRGPGLVSFYNDKLVSKSEGMKMLSKKITLEEIETQGFTGKAAVLEVDEEFKAKHGSSAPMFSRKGKRERLIIKKIGKDGSRWDRFVKLAKAPGVAYHELADWLILKTLDSGIPFKRMVEQIGDVPPTEDPYIAWRLLAGDSAVIEDWLGVNKGTEGAVPYHIEDRLNGRWGKSLKDILLPVMDSKEEFDDFIEFIVARRAQELMLVDKEKLYTDEEIEYGLSLETEKFTRVAADLYRYNDDLVKYAVDAGFLSPEVAVKFKRYSFYIPFQREAEHEGDVGSGRKGTVFKRLTGGRQNIRHPIENMIDNTSSILHAANRNAALVKALHLAETHPDGKRWIERVTMPKAAIQLPTTRIIESLQKQGLDMDQQSAEELAYMQTFFQNKPIGDEKNRIVIVKEGGDPVALKIHDETMWEALHAMAPMELGLLVDALAVPAETLKAGIVTDPAFMTANMTRDTFSGWVQSRKDISMPPVAGTVAGIAKAATASESYKLFRAMGGAHGDFWHGDSRETHQSLKRLAEAGKFQPGTVLNPMSWWRLLRKLGTISESGTRLTGFDKTLALDPGDPGQALIGAIEGRDISVDFSKHGTSKALRVLERITPFLNPAKQGIYRMGQVVGEQPFTTALRGAPILALTFYLWMLNKDEDWYKDVEDWEKNHYWHFDFGARTPQGLVVPFRLPKPFEYGALFGSFAEALFQYLYDNDGEEAVNRVASTIEDVFILRGYPTVLTFPVELMTNYSFFTERHIVPPSKDGKIEAYRQFGPNTSVVAREVGEALDMSPYKLEHTVRSVLGALGMYALMAVDEPLAKLTGTPSKPSRHWWQMPVFRRFFSDPLRPNGKAMTDFYNDMNSHSMTQNTFKDIAGDPSISEEDKENFFTDRDFKKGTVDDVAKGGEESFLIDMEKDVAGVLADLRSANKHIRNDPKLSRDDKRDQIDVNTITMKQTVKDFNKAKEEYRAE